MKNAATTRWRSVGAYVLAPLLLLMALAAWGLSSPIGSSPDEDFHLNSAWCGLGERAGLCEAGPTATSRETPFVLSHIACYAYKADQTGACQWLWDTKLTPTSRVNANHNYPPVFYAVMGVFASSHHIVASVLAMRLFNILLFVALGVALYWLLPPPRRFPLVISWAITAVPLSVFLIASANPSGWTIVGCATAWLAALGFFEGEGRSRLGLGILAIIGAVMATGSRADGAIFCLFGVCVAFLIAHARATRLWRLPNLWLPIAVGLMAIASFVSSSQSLNAITGVHSGAKSTATATAAATATATAHATATATATPSPVATAVATAGATPVTPASTGGAEHGISLLFHNLLDVSWLWTGALGGAPIGWLDTEMPTIVEAVGVFAFGAVVFLGLRVMDWRKALGLVAVFAALIIIPIYELQRSGDRVGHNVQPRYLLPLLLLLAGIAVLPAAGRAVWLNRAQRVVLIVALAVSNAAALYANLARYVHVPPNEGFNLNHGVAWWWSVGAPSPMVLWFLGSLAFAAALALTVWGTRAVPFEDAAVIIAAEPLGPVASD